MVIGNGQLPDFLIVGAAKSATTSLYAYLRQHPAIFIPTHKEPHFFSYADTEFAWSLRAKTISEYISLFAPAEAGQIVGEASTTYLYNYARAIESIRKAYGPAAKKIKIIISLRNPADRAFSHYSMYKLIGLETLPFSEAVRAGAVDRLNENLDTERFGITLDYLMAGMYYEQVKAYKEAFPSVHIILYEDFKRDPHRIVRELFRFLGVAEDVSVVCTAVHNATGVPRISALNNLCNAVNKVIVTRKSKVKNGILRFVQFFIDWDTLWAYARIIVLRVLYRIRFMNVRRASIPLPERQRLAGIYREDILKLQGLIGRDLSSWLS